MVRRIFVEKKKGFDVEAQGLFEDIKTNLHIAGLTGVRVINRYDVQGVDEKTYEMAKYSVFAEPAIDSVYEEKLDDAMVSANFFAVEFLPGQYDQRADSAATCIRLIEPSEMKGIFVPKYLLYRTSLVLLFTPSVTSAKENPNEKSRKAAMYSSYSISNDTSPIDLLRISIS